MMPDRVLKLGFIVSLLIIAGSVYQVFALIKRLYYKEGFEMRDFLVLIISVIMMYFIFFKVPTLIPNIFSVQDFNNVFSMVGLR